jgi:DNA-binding CsgD family transcriptional regulator
LAARIGDDALTCEALAVYALVQLNSGRGLDRERMERALELEAGLAEPVATPHIVHLLVWTGDVERAREHIDRWARWARPRDHPSQGGADWYLALLECRHGDWEAAAHAAESAVAVEEQFGREATTVASWPLAIVTAHRGEVDRARALADRALAAVGRPAVAEYSYAWVLGFLELSVGDARGALKHLDPAGRGHPGLGIREPGMQWFMPDLLEALLALGEPARAEELLAPFARLARELDRPWAVAIAARNEALLHAARGDHDSALASFEEAFAAHDRVPDLFQYARTLLALGATQRRVKQRGAARQTLEQALAIFTDLPAPLWAEKARAELARIGGRAPSRGQLTEAEWRIAALVAEGRTIREIAATLFLTEHTVETALTRIYRKLDVRSRTELGSRLRAPTT